MNIKDFTLRARALLFEEVSHLLEGVYGVLPDGNLAKPEQLPAMHALPLAQQTRQRIEQFLEEESAAHGRKGAVEKLTREVAFTHLNRFSALKMMEARKLIRGTVDKGYQSNAYQFYLADHPEEEKLHDAGATPIDALAEGPRDRAYRHFLLHVFEEISQEIKVLFDPSDLASQLFPRPTALKELLELLNASEMQEHWAPGNDETIGWIYQHFHSEELEAAFRDARLTGKKFEKEDIPAVTQLFTPRWIVQYLVQNTLGQLWLEMHPDSKLASQWEYFIPNVQPRSQKQLPSFAQEISFLDPACGTMHFGLVAFDLLVEIYQEELERAGEEGWRQGTSVNSPEDIPGAIIENNLFGIDIDLRAIQLSALALYLRAKTLNKKAEIKVSNLVCADLLLLNGTRIEEFLNEMQFEQPIYERVIKCVWDELKHAGHFGSLLRPELTIQSLLEKEQISQGNIFDQNKLTNVSKPDFWEVLDVQIIQAFDEFARRHASEQKYSSGIFTDDAVKGMKLLEVMMRQYDVVVANPPYMSGRKMNTDFKNFLAKNYPAGKGDTYAAFIQRCLEFAGDDGRVGMLTMHSFMFITSYQNLRDWAAKNSIVETMLHLGPALFDVGNPGTLQTVAFTLRREPNATTRAESVGTYFRLVHEKDSVAKRLAFEAALKVLLTGETSPAVYRYQQSNFESIPGSPWVYWITPGLRALFRDLPKLGDIAPPRQGLSTADNTRFLRYWWEVGNENIGLNQSDRNAMQASGKMWVPFMKGGKSKRWWANQEYVLNWKNDGVELKHIATIRNEKFYFQQGVTWGLLTTGRFSARFSPGGFIFDSAGSSGFPQDPFEMLGLLNSLYTQYSLSLINPTVNFSVGDIARLPFPKRISPTFNSLVETAINLSRANSAEDETTYEFVTPLWRGDLKSTFTTLQERQSELAAIENQIDEEVFVLYDISSEDRAAIERELGTAAIETDDAEDTPDDEDETDVDNGTATARIAKNWISYAVGAVLGRFSLPESCRLQRSDDGLATLHENGSNDLAVQVEEVLHAALGMTGEEEVLEAALGSSERAALQRYLERHFFEEHLRRYRKRPVYWLLQSPKKKISYMIFHERITADTLHSLRGLNHLGAVINGLTRGISSQRDELAKLEGSARRNLEREIEEKEEQLRDARDFEKHLDAIINYQDESGAVVGWRPERDDGVAINLAPLRSIFPSWNKSTSDITKAWKALEKGDYDWSRTARRYWPNRVLEKCKTNQSYAIAHGVEVSEE